MNMNDDDMKQLKDPALMASVLDGIGTCETLVRQMEEIADTFRNIIAPEEICRCMEMVRDISLMLLRLDSAERLHVSMKVAAIMMKTHLSAALQGLADGEIKLDQ